MDNWIFKMAMTRCLRRVVVSAVVFVAIVSLTLADQRYIYRASDAAEADYFFDSCG